MPSTQDKKVVGGILQGIGQGMLLKSENQREERLILQQEARQRARDLRLHSYRTDEIKDRNERDRGLLSSIQVDDKNQTYGITRGGEKIDLGITARPQATKKAGSKDDESGLSVNDKRVLDTLINRFTTGKGSLEGESVDWAAIEEALRRDGRDDLADLIAVEGQQAGIDVSGAEYTEAQRLAEEWADDTAGVFRSDKKDFADHGGSRTQAIQAKTMEFYKQLTGQDLPARGSEQQQVATQDAGSPSGSGSQEDPFVAATQADIEWFKASAPPGAIIEIEGTLYQK